MHAFCEGTRLTGIFKKLKCLLFAPDTAGPTASTDNWSIGIYHGPSPVDLHPPDQITNPVLTAANVTDIAADFVADPFMLRTNGVWVMFFEVFNRDTRLGNIGYATSTDAFDWKYGGIVLAEPFSLSYPYVFQWQNDYYMIPEACQTRSVRLYRAIDFPRRWVLDKVLLKRQRFTDASVFYHQRRWWMFVGTRSRPVNNGRLRLYLADDLKGRWREHPCSPVMDQNPHQARPAGRVQVWNDRVIRYAQDDYPQYGRQVWGFDITTLDSRNYAETLIGDAPLLQPGLQDWHSRGMHTVDAHQVDTNYWIACVDGLAGA